LGFRSIRALDALKALKPTVSVESHRDLKPRHLGARGFSNPGLEIGSSRRTASKPVPPLFCSSPQDIAAVR
jgi:hypothetical protein